MQKNIANSDSNLHSPSIIQQKLKQVD